jgi:hypothetical protein
MTHTKKPMGIRSAPACTAASRAFALRGGNGALGRAYSKGADS